MSTTVAILLIVTIVAIAVAAWAFLEKRRTQRLQTRFGPEYDRMVQSSGRRKAEASLDERAKRVDKLHIRPLRNDERARFSEAWRREQARFVDDPRAAVNSADRLVGEAMQARGYPMSDFEQRVDDISVDHPQVVENYRIAHQIAINDSRGQGSTEDLRRAMVHYRALFEELLEEHVLEHQEART